MKTEIIWIIFLWGQCTIGQILDNSTIWEVKCPKQCCCQFLQYADLPLHNWINSTKVSQKDSYNYANPNHPLAKELLKVATCIIAEDPTEILQNLPHDVQVLALLESGIGNVKIKLLSSHFQHFTNLTSLDIRGIEYKKNSIIKGSWIHKKGGIIIAADTLLPINSTLRYLNLERLKLTRPMTKRKTDFTIKKNNKRYSKNHKVITRNNFTVILLNEDDTENENILPYDVYKKNIGNFISLDVFQGLSKLTHLRIYDCALREISWRVFDDLKNLEYLSLEKNELKFVPDFCFSGIPNLKTLSLANNQLLTLNSFDLEGLNFLQKLDISGNNLTYMNEQTFPPFPSLLYIDISNNFLEAVFPNTFTLLNKTQTLMLGGNNTKLKMNTNFFSGLQNLSSLHLLNFKIPQLEHLMLRDMPMLTDLKIQGNVTSIEFDAFADLVNIRDLDLSHCHIRSVSQDAFYGLEKVNRIDLSYNDLKFIPPGLFSLQQQKQLKEIFLNKNRLTVLPQNFFKYIHSKPQKIQNLRLDGNPWDCTCSIAFWNHHMVNRNKGTLPRCFTPPSLQYWGVYYALRKGGLRCYYPKQKVSKKFQKEKNLVNNNTITR